MFTGIVEKIGVCKGKKKKGTYVECSFEVKDMWPDLVVGESIAVNGVCLTVTKFTASAFSADISYPTIKASTLGFLMKGAIVHLERAVPVNGRFGGHIVQGHVDGTGIVQSTTKRSGNLFLQIKASEFIMDQLIHKGSVAVDGVSLTIQELTASWFGVVLIPHTLKETRFASVKKNDVVNVEVDVISKYVKKFVASKKSSLNEGYLLEQGF